ncbi:AAA family ATPase [Paenibacillus sp. CAU 1782]
MEMDFIILHGSPGNGKTTLARMLHEHLKAPYFEFGWIPEFRSLTPYTDISQAEEEQLSFENLILVAKNYNSHGFKHIILTDLNDIRMTDIPHVFKGYRYIILTLYSDHEDVIKQRVLTRDNGNGYCDWEASISMNALIASRETLPNEYRIENSRPNAEKTLDILLDLIKNHEPDDSSDISIERQQYYSYIDHA